MTDSLKSYASSETSPLLTQPTLERTVADVALDQGAHEESKTIKVARIAFTALGLVVCFSSNIPSILNAKSFNLFPGSQDISAGAEIVEGFFGADNMIELSHLIFGAQGTDERRITWAKGGRLLLCCALGILSRMRGAGLTIAVAPIPKRLQLPLSLYKLVGTSAPEIVSSYNTLDLRAEKVRLLFKKSEQEALLLHIRQNLVNHLLVFKQRILDLSDEESHQLLLNLLGAFSQSNGDGLEVTRRVFDRVVTEANSQVVQERKTTSWTRSLFNIATATATSLAGSCTLGLSTVLSKYAYNTLIPWGGDASWKWAPALLSTSTIAYTTYRQSYQGAQSAITRVLSLFGGPKDREVGEALYPKAHFAYSVLAQALVIALFGGHFESVRGAMGLSSWIGKAVLTGVTASSYFLYSQAMQNFFEKAARAFAASRLGSQDAKQMAEAVTKLEKIADLFSGSSLNDFGKLLVSLQGMLKREQKEALIQGITVDSRQITVEEFDDFVRTLEHTPRQELSSVAEEAKPLLSAEQTV